MYRACSVQRVVKNGVGCRRRAYGLRRFRALRFRSSRSAPFASLSKCETSSDNPPWYPRLVVVGTTQWRECRGRNSSRSESPVYVLNVTAVAGEEVQAVYLTMHSAPSAWLISTMRRLIAWCHARRHRHTEVTLRLLHLRPTQPASWRPQRKASGMAACRWYRAVRC